MSKIELDDMILEHPKFVRLLQEGGPSVLAYWLGLRAYCSQQLTDGFIPDHMLDECRAAAVRASSRRRAVDILVSCRLLHIVDGGVQLHDYLDHAQSRDQVLAWRKANADRKAKSRERSRRDSQRDTSAGHGVTHSVTHPQVTASVTAGVPAPSASASASASDISPSEIYMAPQAAPKPPRTRQAPRVLTEPPDALEPTPATLAVANKTGRDWRSDWERCRDWAKGKGERRADWQATLRNWMTSPINAIGGSNGNGAKPIEKWGPGCGNGPQPNNPDNPYVPKEFTL